MVKLEQNYRSTARILNADIDTAGAREIRRERPSPRRLEGSLPTGEALEAELAAAGLAVATAPRSRQRRAP